VKVEAGQLRRFHDDAFIGEHHRHLNGTMFLVLDASGSDTHKYKRSATILVDGTLDYDWGPRVLEDFSEVVSAG
jgi:hypothetical protein